MKKFLIVVDMQRDFVDGTLGSGEAVSIVAGVCDKIKNFDGTVFVTFDTHTDGYLKTAEGKKLPVPHCVKGTEGWQLNQSVALALSAKKYIPVEKAAFASTSLPALLEREAAGDDFSIELVGLCTDICVVSNALLLKAFFPEKAIAVDAACCAGVSPQTHEAALKTMRCCQIDVYDSSIEARR